jgi:hypothetical protein
VSSPAQRSTNLTWVLLRKPLEHSVLGKGSTPTIPPNAKDPKAVMLVNILFRRIARGGRGVVTWQGED